MPQHAPHPNAAARELLGGKFDYRGDGCKVKPYAGPLVSMPAAGSSPVDLGRVAPFLEKVP
eukprot:8270769-Alexandrium_andersonii.AAC.1